MLDVVLSRPKYLHRGARHPRHHRRLHPVVEGQPSTETAAFLCDVHLHRFHRKAKRCCQQLLKGERVLHRPPSLAEVLLNVGGEAHGFHAGVRQQGQLVLRFHSLRRCMEGACNIAFVPNDLLPRFVLELQELFVDFVRAVLSVRPLVPPNPQCFPAFDGRPRVLCKDSHAASG